MRIAVAQGPNPGGDVGANLGWLEAAARDAAAGGAALVVAPEMALSGYAIGPEAVRRLAEPVDGPSARAAARIAREHRIALCYGYPEAGADGRVYNAALLIGPSGETLANHRKSHLYGELDRSAFAAGAGEPTVATVDRMKLGILICYDVEFPENVRLLALAGVDLVLVPTALMAPYDFIPGPVLATRAYENQVFLAYANRCGSEGELSYLGQSCVVGPDGRDLARAGARAELILADLDPGLLAASRGLNTYLADRRPAVYRGLAEER